MSLYLVSLRETIVRVCVVDAMSEDDAAHVSARLPVDAWRVVHYDIDDVASQPVDGVPPETPA